MLQGRHPISIRVLDLIPPEFFADMTVAGLSAHVRDLIADELGDAEPAAGPA